MEATAMNQQSLSEFEVHAEQRARHRALILQILAKHPDGLTTMQIMDKEKEWFGYTFLSDNRLRELRKAGLVVNVVCEGKPMLWKTMPEGEEKP
jgi:hypothetical protein